MANFYISLNVIILKEITLNLHYLYYMNDLPVSSHNSTEMPFSTKRSIQIRWSSLSVSVGPLISAKNGVCWSFAGSASSPDSASSTRLGGPPVTNKSGNPGAADQPSTTSLRSTQVTMFGGACSARNSAPAVLVSPARRDPSWAIA